MRMIGIVLALIFTLAVTAGCGSEPQVRDKAGGVTAMVKPQAIAYVSGFVVKPGTYNVPVGTPVNEVIKLAGGFRPEADTARVNLGGIVDGTIQIFVPKLGETGPVQQAAEPSASVRQPGPEKYQSATASQPRVYRPQISSSASSLEQELVDMVNRERSRLGLAPLAVDSRLVKVARLKSQDMFDKEYFGHQSPTYGSPSSMVSSYGIKYHIVGENLAGAGSIGEAHSGLMGSPGHRSNILNREYNKIGIGIVDSGRYGLIITQLFIGD